MKRSRGRVILFYALVFLVSFSLSPLFMKEATAAPAETKYETFYWGSYFELTGPGAAWGISSLMALRMAIEEINAAGGFKVGNTHYKIKLLEGDTEGKTEKAVAVVTKQLNENHPLIFSGPGISITAAPILEMVKSRKDFINLSHATIIANRCGESPLLFNVGPRSQWLAPDTVDYIIDKLKIKSVAIMAGSDEFGHLAAEQEYAPQFRRRGVKVTDIVYFPPDTHDFYAFLSKIKQNKPDAICICYYDPHTQGIIRQALELGITKTFINRAGSIHGAEPFKNQIDHYVWTAMWDMDNTKDPPLLAYKERYKKRYDRYPMNKYNDAAGIMHYDTTFMVVKAIEKAGTVTDVKKIADTLRKSVYMGKITGKIFFRETGNAIYYCWGGHMKRGGELDYFKIMPKPELADKKY
jgi:branched-chain amino acid transport system substrate-binding protein